MMVKITYFTYEGFVKGKGIKVKDGLLDREHIMYGVLRTYSSVRFREDK